MRRRRSATLGAVFAGLALAVGVGGALAHDGNGKGGAKAGGKTCAERLATIAKAKGVTVEKLQADRKAMATAWVDKALEKKRITAEQAAALKKKIEASDGCAPAVFGGPGGRGHHGGPPPGKGPGDDRGGHSAGKAILTYLGITQDALRADLKAGKSLAEIATAKGKSVDGLKALITSEMKAPLDKWLADGKLSKERYDKAVAALPKLVDRIVNAKRGDHAKGKDKDRTRTSRRPCRLAAARADGPPPGRLRVGPLRRAYVCLWRVADRSCSATERDEGPPCGPSSRQGHRSEGPLSPDDPGLTKGQSR